MSSRPGAVRKHRRSSGERIALRQWKNRVKRNPKEMAKISVREAMAYILSQQPDHKMPKDRLYAILYLMSEAGVIRSPKPTKRDLTEVGRRLLRSDDSEDINIATCALNAAGAWHA